MFTLQVHVDTDQAEPERMPTMQNQKGQGEKEIAKMFQKYVEGLK